jgi:two-component SAPR family response regulator
MTKRALSDSCAMEPGHASNAVREEPVDLILTDLNMSGTNGLMLIDQVKKIHPDVWSVLHTSDARLALDPSLEIPILVKPVEPEALCAIITWFLGAEVRGSGANRNKSLDP